MPRTLKRWSVWVAATLVIACSPEPNYQAYDSAPVKSLRISVESTATQPFLVQLERFAQSKSMKMWRSIVSPDQRNFSIAIQGDVQIIAVNNAEFYEVAFYQNKAKPLSEASVDAFVQDMKGNLGKVHGVTFPTFSKRPDLR